MKTIKKYSNCIVEYLFQLFLMKILLSFISPLLGSLGISNTGTVTLALYFIMLIRFFVIVCRYSRIQISDIIILLIFYSVFILNYVLFPDTRPYFLSQEMLMNYLMFLPICVIGITKIDTWDVFFELGAKYSYAGVIVACLIFVFNLISGLNYMEFSYSILALGGIAAINVSQRYKMIDIATLVLYFLIIISYGARSPILLLACVFVAGVLFNEQRTKTLIFSAVFILCLSIAFSTGLFENLLLRIFSDTGSYAILRILNGTFFQSNERNALYEAADSYVANMGLSINGLFGDRALSMQFGQPYIHNVVYEILFSFGWIIGLFIIAVFLFKSLRILFKCKNNERLVFLYALFALFGRYLLSGSFVVEWRFYIFIALMTALQRGRKITLKVGNIKLTNRA